MKRVLVVTMWWSLAYVSAVPLAVLRGLGILSDQAIEHIYLGVVHNNQLRSGLHSFGGLYTFCMKCRNNPIHPIDYIACYSNGVFSVKLKDEFIQQARRNGVQPEKTCWPVGWMVHHVLDVLARNITEEMIAPGSVIPEQLYDDKTGITFVVHSHGKEQYPVIRTAYPQITGKEKVHTIDGAVYASAHDALVELLNHAPDMTAGLSDAVHLVT